MQSLQVRGTPSVGGGNETPRDRAPVNRDGSMMAAAPPDFYADTQKAIIIKWSVICGIFILLSLWFVIGHLHAKRRLRQGLPLLFYHRFLVASTKKASSPFATNTRDPERAEHSDFYAPPPPAYDSTEKPPPSYQPPSKDFQHASAQTPETLPTHGKEQTAPPKKSFFPKSWKLGRKT